MTLTSFMYTVKRDDGKLRRQTDWMTQFSSIRGTEHFFDMQIELIRQVPTMKMINKKDHGDEHHFCMTRIRIGILNSYLNSDQFLFSIYC